MFYGEFYSNTGEIYNELKKLTYLIRILEKMNQVFKKSFIRSI